MRRRFSSGNLKGAGDPPQTWVIDLLVCSERRGGSLALFIRSGILCTFEDLRGMDRI